jgi:hypothetical protein
MVSRDDVSQSVDTFRFMAGAARAITSPGRRAKSFVLVIVAPG